MLCCCAIENAEIEGIELGTFSDENDTRKNEQEIVEGGKRKKWYLDVSDIVLRKNEKKLAPNLDDVRYLKWHNRSKHTLIFLESQMKSEMEALEHNRVKKKKKKLPPEDKDRFLDKLVALAEKVNNESDSMKNRSDITACMERKRRLKQLKLERERIQRNFDNDSADDVSDKDIMENLRDKNILDDVKEKKEQQSDKLPVHIKLSNNKKESHVLVEVEPVWVTTVDEKKKPKEIGGFLSDLRSLHLDNGTADGTTATSPRKTDQDTSESQKKQ